MPFVKPSFCLFVSLFTFLHSPLWAQVTGFPLQLATPYHDDIAIEQYWVSEKLDGIRARWDGKALVTRNGNKINAPEFFTRGFPTQQIEGELWMGRGTFQQTLSVVLRQSAGEEWQNVRFMLFDLPTHTGTFHQRLIALKTLVAQANNPNLQLIKQFRVANKLKLDQLLGTLVKQGAEGLMLHHQDARYQDGRSQSLLKLKVFEDAEATVIGHVEGKGRNKNKLGALLVELDDGTQFKIGGGFTDLERQFPPSIGSIITFKYYGVSEQGVPRFASFLRVYVPQ